MPKIKNPFNRNTLKILVNWMVENVEYILVRAMEVSTPIPATTATIFALKTVWPMWASILGGIVIEISAFGLGRFIGAMHASGRPKYRNLGMALYALQFAVVLSVVGGFKTGPAIYAWLFEGGTSREAIEGFVYVALPFLTVVGSVLLGVREAIAHNDTKVEATATRALRDEDLQYTVAEKEAQLKLVDLEETLRIERENKVEKLRMDRVAQGERVALSLERRATRVAQPRPTATRVATERGEADRKQKERRATLLTALQAGEKFSNREWARRLRVQPRTIGNDWAGLQEDGLIHINGNGPELVTHES